MTIYLELIKCNYSIDNSFMIFGINPLYTVIYAYPSGAFPILDL